MVLTKLTRMDNCPIQDNPFTNEFMVWITQQVDILNQDMQFIDDMLVVIDARLTAGGL